MLAYFEEKQQGFSPSSLWSLYSMLKATILVKKNIDISRFPKLIAFIKRQNDGYKPKKSKVLTREEMDRFLKDAPNDKYLLSKVVLTLGVAGACRGNELCTSKITDVCDVGDMLVVNIRDTKTNVDRTFTIVNNDRSNLNFVELCRKYMSLRKPNTNHDRFFVYYKDNKCTVQPIGKNFFGKLPRQIATFLNLSDAHLYTGHCFRRSSASLLADAGADVSALKRHGGWRSATVAEGYVENSLNNKIQTAEKILIGHEQGTSTVNANSSTSANVAIKEIRGEHVAPIINLHNCENCIINVNIAK
ncbi:uncharacterized protein LOC116182690 [Photinus pyralis]|nr:uncharacterized protein LOC116182690 [Photinus pyralis]